jgi:hypothetical protein
MVQPSHLNLAYSTLPVKLSYCTEEGGKGTTLAIEYAALAPYGGQRLASLRGHASVGVCVRYVGHCLVILNER